MLAPSQTQPTATLNVDIRQLLTMVNIEKSPDTLGVHLVQAANLSGVFDLFKHFQELGRDSNPARVLIKQRIQNPTPTPIP